VPGQLALGEGKLKKGQGLPRVPWHLALGEGKIKKKTEHSGKSFPKKRISSPSVALGEEVQKKKKFLPRVLHSRKSKKIRSTALNLPRVMALEEPLSTATTFRSHIHHINL
jgi:hypothetical protein